MQCYCTVFDIIELVTCNYVLTWSKYADADVSSEAHMLSFSTYWSILIKNEMALPS